MQSNIPVRTHRVPTKVLSLGKDGKVHIHLTLSPEQADEVEKAAWPRSVTGFVRSSVLVAARAANEGGGK